MKIAHIDIEDMQKVLAGEMAHNEYMAKHAKVSPHEEYLREQLRFHSELLKGMPEDHPAREKQEELVDEILEDLRLLKE